MMMLMRTLQGNLSVNFTQWGETCPLDLPFYERTYISKPTLHFLIREISTLSRFYLILSKLFLPHTIFIKYFFFSTK